MMLPLVMFPDVLPTNGAWHARSEVSAQQEIMQFASYDVVCPDSVVMQLSS